MRKISYSTIRLFAMALALGMVFVLTPRPTMAGVHVGVFVNFAPPELPVYAQPVCPGPNYIWTPGYWAWDPNVGDYYWVPGTWVMPPEVGFLWTPGYWAWGADGYFFNAGYWGPTVGFYGGIDYGFGYYGHGFDGGRWEHGHFFYNREVNNVDISIVHNVYNERAIHEYGGVSRVSFNGGRGGVNASPTAREEAAARERHIPRDSAQMRHINEARANRQLRASVNHGAPPIAATQRPSDFRGRGVMKTRVPGEVHIPAARSANNAEGRGNTAAPVNPHVNQGAHPGYTPAAHRSTVAPNRGNSGARNSFRQQQNQMKARQQRERQQLQQQQGRERQQMQRQRANNAARQQMAQRQQRQMQQMAQRHAQERQQFQRRQAPKQEARPHGRPH